MKSILKDSESIEQTLEYQCLNGRRDFTEDEWNTLLSINGFLIEDMENPTEEQKMKAVINAPYAIEYINNPSIELQKAAIKKDPFSVWALITYNYETGVWEIDKLSEEIKQFALTQPDFAKYNGVFPTKCPSY
jgi:hypothetical protein